MRRPFWLVQLFPSTTYERKYAMKPLHFFFFIVTIPFLISLGHDLYVFYAEQNSNIDLKTITKIYTEDRPGKSFDFASFGYIWTTYSPDSYQLMSQSFDPAEWAGIQEFLKFKSTILFGVFAVFMYLCGALFALLNRPKQAKKIRRRG